MVMAGSGPSVSLLGDCESTMRTIRPSVPIAAVTHRGRSTDKCVASVRFLATHPTPLPTIGCHLFKYDVGIAGSYLRGAGPLSAAKRIRLADSANHSQYATKRVNVATRDHHPQKRKEEDLRITRLQTCFLRIQVEANLPRSILQPTLAVNRENKWAKSLTRSKARLSESRAR